MSDPDAAESGRLPTDIWVRAGLRTCSSHGIPAYVRQRGDAHGGAVALKLDMGAAGCRILSQTRTPAGAFAWLDVFQGATDASRAEDYVARARRRDPDLWIIEIEHPTGWHPYAGPIL